MHCHLMKEAIEHSRSSMESSMESSEVVGGHQRSSVINKWSSVIINGHPGNQAAITSTRAIGQSDIVPGATLAASTGAGADRSSGLMYCGGQLGKQRPTNAVGIGVNSSGCCE